jgi:hypothetical protein
MELVAPGTDWRDARTFAPLLDADRPIFAWEWLRRDPDYRAAATIAAQHGKGDGDAAHWGLHRFEDPDRAAPGARPLWRAGHHPYVLKARAAPPASPSDAVELGRFAALATFDAGEGEGEHWLLSDGLRGIRLDLVDGTATRGPVELHYLLAGRASASGPLLTLRRLLAFAETGSFSRTLHPREPKARRWILALRANDALAAGASQRDIAALLLGDAAGEARWRVHAASLRSQVQRLVRAARAFADGGYRHFLS